jgi:hypothetical protein
MLLVEGNELYIKQNIPMNELTSFTCDSLSLFIANCDKVRRISFIKIEELSPAAEINAYRRVNELIM